MARRQRMQKPPPVARPGEDVDLFSDAAEMRRTIIETSPDFILILTPDGTIRYINRVLQELEGTNVIGSSVFDYVPADDLVEMKSAFERVLATGELDAYETSYDSPERGRLTFECRMAPIFREGRIVGLTINARDVTEQKRTEQALRDAAQSQRTLIENSPVGIVTVNGEGRFVTANSAFHRMLGYEDGAIAGNTVLQITHPDDIESSKQLLGRILSGSASQETIEKRLRHVDGHYVWVRVSASAICDEMGRFLRAVAVIEDVSERKMSEHRQRRLVRELDHRVKNNLAAIVSLVEQTIATSESLEAFERTFVGRVSAMARSHEALAQAKWTELDLEQAVSEALAAYLQESPPRVSLVGEPIKLQSRTVMPLCLALHELATNAMRHGALSSLQGHVTIFWTREANTLRLQWREAGGPPVSTPTKPGLGTQLIEGFVRFELHGELDIRYPPSGFECDISIPNTNAASS